MEKARESLLKGQTMAHLTAEKVVWSAWTRMSDREVAREAAAKGQHLQLAKQFLSKRLNLTEIETRKWMVDEILRWVSELLKRRQVYKASHILSNMELDVGDEIMKIFRKTTNKDLRDYLGNHLISINKMQEDILQAWHLLTNILNNNVALDVEKDKVNVDYIIEQSKDWKCEVGSELFFKTFDRSLEGFLKSEYMWKSLLKLNKPDIIKFWIHSQFGRANETDDEPYEDLRNICNLHIITPTLINRILSDELSVPRETQESVLNELSRFGIFCEVEENDVLCIIKRLILTNSLERIEEIFSGNHCSININDFNNLIARYCVNNNLYTLLNTSCVKVDLLNNEVGLITSCMEAATNLNVLDVIVKNINYVNSYLLTKSVFISLCLIVLSKHDLLDSFKKSIVYKKEEGRKAECLDKLICFKKIFGKFNGTTEKSLAIYDLVKLYSSKNLMNFRFERPSTNIGHFKDEQLVQKYGYKKNVNFLFYLRQHRPCAASKIFFCNDLNHLVAIEKTCKLATRNFTNYDMGASCIVFLELIGAQSDMLRLHLSIARLLYQQTEDRALVQSLFDKVSNNSAMILSFLEDCLVKESKHSDGKSFIKLLKQYSLACKFAQQHNLKLPEKLLKNLANQNQWLLFLTFIQQENYSLEQVKRLTLHFRNLTCLEHLSHSVNNDTVIYSKKELLMKERDSRKSFLSRIGVRQKVEMHSDSSSTSSTLDVETDVFDTKTNLLQVLIKCHNSSDPPKALLQACEQYRNPVLAIFAASYEPDSVIVNWLTWLTVSCNLKLPKENLLNLEILALNANMVSDFMSAILKLGFYKNLLYSFQIFLSDNPLRSMMEFLQSLYLDHDVDYLKSHLDSFKKQLNQTSSNCIVITTDHEMSYFNNKVWIENQALTFISLFLQYYFKSRYEQTKAVHLLCRLEVEKYFTVKCPKYANVLQLLELIEESGISVEVDLSVLHDVPLHKRKVNGYIEELLEKNLYEASLNLAKLEDISTDNILLRQWTYKLRNHQGDYNEFWNDCYDAFIKSTAIPENIIRFYLNAARNSSNNQEKYTILKKAYEHANKHRMPIYEIERDMWISLLTIDDKSKKFESDSSMSAFFYTEMLDKLDTIKIEPCKLNEETIVKLDKAIDDMLDKNDIFQALKLEKLFDHKHADLDIIKLMFSLAEKLTLPYQLTPEERLLVNKSKRNRNLSRRRNFLSHVSSISVSSYTSGNTSIIYIPDNMHENPTQDTLAILESLIQHINNGVDIAQRLLMFYRISVNIEKEYHEIVTIKRPMRMLKDALENDCRNKLEVVYDFVTVYKWSKEEIAQFICSEIQTAIMKYAPINNGPVVLWDLNLSTDFHLILQLLPDNCSMLGIKLYTYANSLYKYQTESEENYDITTLSIIIELLIRAHACFTMDCNMENITLVLKKCQMVVSILVNLQCWRLMVRLLTGIGRYTEMNYVFQILNENEQFTYLLKEGVSKDAALKVALLDYLKKFCPDNEELYKMVALHFSLFSEVAQLWEKEAENYVKTLVEISKLEMQNNKFNPEVEPFVLLQSDDSTRNTLTKVMTNYNRAAEYHLLGHKLTKSLNSAKQAELLALQISLLSRKENVCTCILNLKPMQILYLITNSFSFPQSRILIEAYNYPVDWSNVIFEQYVVNNQKDYLNDFTTYIPLTDSLVQNVSRKFLNGKHNSLTMAKNMKNILQTLSSVHVKYKLASELGFIEMVEEILESNQLSFLKDTVWKKGYKDV